MWLLPGQTGETWEPSGNRGTFYGKLLSVFNTAVLLFTLSVLETEQMHLHNDVTHFIVL